MLSLVFVLTAFGFAVALSLVVELSGSNWWMERLWCGLVDVVHGLIFGVRRSRLADHNRIRQLETELLQTKE